MIKFWSYKEEYNKIRKKILKNIDNTLSKGNIFFGEQIKRLEKNFAKKYKSKYGVAVGSGTDALAISLLALNLKKSDEIITAVNTAIPTISAIILAGAKPKLVDIGEDYLIDQKKIVNSINKNTKAIIPVHLYGHPCDMNNISNIAKKYKLKVIEDCAQAQGAMFNNKYVGTFGNFGCFSFYPTKIFGAYGDGGFIITNDFNYYKKIKRIRYYGIETYDKKSKFLNKYYANENGLNSRIDEIQCSILNLKFSSIDRDIKKRIKLANLYNKELKNTNLVLPIQNNNSKPVYHLFTVYHPQRKLIINYLKKNKIETRIIYEYPIDEMKAYNKNNSKMNCINALIKSKGIFSLPLYPNLKKQDILFICKKIKECLKFYKI